MDLTTTPASVRREVNQKFDALPIFRRDRSTALYGCHRSHNSSELSTAIGSTSLPMTQNGDWENIRPVDPVRTLGHLPLGQVFPKKKSCIQAFVEKRAERQGYS
jgi:hypothetical protein